MLLNSRRLLMAATFLLGALSPVVSQRLQGGIQFTTLWIPIALVAAFSSLGVWRGQLRIVEVASTIAIGVAVGLLADATLDYALFSRDRALFGLEVMFWLATLIGPALFAMGIARLIQKWSQ